MGELRAEVFRRTDGRWAWHAMADNNEIVASDAGQGYENRGDAELMMVRVLGANAYDVAADRLNDVIHQALTDALRSPEQQQDLEMVARFVAGRVLNLLAGKPVEDSSRQG